MLGNCRKTIVVIDNFKDLLDSTVLLLELQGYNVLNALSGEAGVQLSAGTGIDLVVLDFAMPGMDGAAVGRALRGNPASHNTKIVMFSGTPESMVRASFADYDAFIVKSADPDRLLRTVARLLS